MAIAIIVLTVAAVAAGTGAAVLHARVRALQEQAVTDPLTGAFNRRQLEVSLAAAVERRRRTGERASILLLDLDRFKDVNDAFAVAEELRGLVLGAGLLPEWDLSISVGVSELAIEQSVRAWLEEADGALYRAKRAGRNRVAGRPSSRELSAANPVPVAVRLS